MMSEADGRNQRPPTSHHSPEIGGLAAMAGYNHSQRTRLIDLSGRRFGRLTALRRSTSNDSYGRPMWDCRCTCGTTRVVTGSNLRRGNSTSCGCFSAEGTARRSTTHGDTAHYTKSKEYLAWRHAKHRCFNPKDHAWKNYGGRGITMCDAWKESFEIFLRDMGRCPPGLTIDRWPNNDGHYEPGNCRWATRLQQNHNRRCSRNH